MASVSYKTTCYSGVEPWKANFDVSRDNVQPEYCIGNNGFDKSLLFEEVVECIAKPKNAHVIIKAGPNAKWYVKDIKADLAHETLKRGTKYCTVKNPNAKCYVVEW